MTEKHIVHKKVGHQFGSAANPRRSAASRDARHTLDVRTEEPRLFENNTESNISTKRDDLDSYIIDVQKIQNERMSNKGDKKNLKHRAWLFSAGQTTYAEMVSSLLV